MRYNPYDLLTKLNELGVHPETEPDYLTHKCNEARTKRTVHKSPQKPDPLPEIKGKGRPLTEIPKNYTACVLNFLGYISDTAKRQFKITFKNLLTGEGFVKWKPYIHRWTSTYRKGVLAKMYQLEAYAGENLTELEFITLTTHQEGITREEQLSQLKIGREKLLDVLRKRYGTQEYVWMLEHFKSGFSHLHLIYFKKLTEEEKESIKTIWHEKYELGNYKNGLYFSAPRASLDGVCVGGSIKSIKNYLIKYIAKGLEPNSESEQNSESYQEYEFHGKKIPLNMSLGELLFNAILKKTKTRLWGCSRLFSKIMKRPEKEGEKDWECIEVDQLYEPYQEEETLEERKEHFMTVLWTKEGGLRPEAVKKWELIKSLPHLSNTDIADAKFNEYKIEPSPIPIINKRGVKVGELPNFNLYRPVWHSIGG